MTTDQSVSRITCNLALLNVDINSTKDIDLKKFINDGRVRFAACILIVEKIARDGNTASVHANDATPAAAAAAAAPSVTTTMCSQVVTTGEVY